MADLRLVAGGLEGVVAPGLDVRIDLGKEILLLDEGEQGLEPTRPVVGR